MEMEITTDFFGDSGICGAFFHLLTTHYVLAGLLWSDDTEPIPKLHLGKFLVSLSFALATRRLNTNSYASSFSRKVSSFKGLWFLLLFQCCQYFSLCLL